MKIDQVSSAAGERQNEDLVAVWRGERCTDLVIIDGGTSVAERDYLGAEVSDVVWFVQAFAQALRDVAGDAATQEQGVLAAAAALRTQFLARAGAMPLYAYPIAAMTWVRVTPGAGAAALDIFCLGDCKTLLRLPDGGVVDLDPYTNPQEGVLQREIELLKGAGVTDPARRLQRLMPLLRRRREEQNTAATPQVLCPLPRGAFDGRSYHLRAEPGSILLMMTDGFSRIVDTYHLRPAASLAQLCMQDGLAAALAELRGHEAAGGSAGASVKAADDASAISCLLGTC